MKRVLDPETNTFKHELRPKPNVPVQKKSFGPCNLTRDEVDTLWLTMDVADFESMLKLAQAGTKAVDPTARAFSSGHAAGLEDAIKLIDKVLQAEHAARIKAAAQGKEGLR